MDELVLRIKSYLPVELHDAEWVSKHNPIILNRNSSYSPC